MFGKKKAVSLLIVTIILIAICVIGGLLVYDMFYITSSTMFSSAHITVESASLVGVSEDRSLLTVTVKNIGNKPITAVQLNVYATSGGPLSGGYGISISLPNGVLEPGQSAGHNIIPIPYGTVAGNEYTIIVQAWCSDGSVVSTTTTVTAS